MRLPAYDVAVTISDPDDPDTQLIFNVGRIKREKLLTTPFPLGGALQMFEASVIDEVIDPVQTSLGGKQ